MHFSSNSFSANEYNKIDFRYISESVDGVKGTIKASPLDFRVEEILSRDFQSHGKHIYLKLEYCDYATKDVERFLSKIFQVHPKEIGHAGLKDANSTIKQTFSVLVEKNVLAESAIRTELENLGIVLWNVNFADKKLRVGELHGNMFTIRLRLDYLVHSKGEIESRVESITDIILKNGIPNFFGLQRFGSKMDNHLKGREILLGKRVANNKWMHNLFVSAYQSFLFNRYLKRRMDEKCFDIELSGDIPKGYLIENSSGDLIQKFTFTGPLYGKKYLKSRDLSLEFEDRILQDELEFLTSQGIPNVGKECLFDRVDGDRRIAKILLEKISIEWCDSDLIFKFFMPKGAYATTLLNEYLRLC